MDIGSLGGLVAGAGLVLAAIMLGSGIGAFIDVPSVLIVVGGTIAAVFIAFPGGELKMVGKVLGRVFKSPKHEMIALMQFLIECRKAVGKDGLLALEGLAEKAPSEAVAKGLLLVADATDAGALQEILATERKAIQERHLTGQKIFNEAAKFAPAFGMVGTLIGLVQMLATLDDPASIGPKMAVALLTTLYGALLANLIFLPMVTKLDRRLNVEMVQLQLAFVGMMALRKEDSIVLMREKFKAFMPERSDLDTALEGQA
ncbi:MAG: MotA/TolQ/ExbB proton channel family protein [Gemmatimonadota bacterium]|nr:MotA/TolQ/ExbB proton channel family protein [Gemmatimonadota bacterium]